MPTEDIISTVAFNEAISERYLRYALSTITARSLPDVRDGLKPVHRRILFSMLQLKLDPSGGFKKCARVVGDVMGKYHPHGDSSIYDALVRMAQTFSSRYPLVEGQGNFGSIDGDNQAAMRYTEARLTPYALLLLGDIEQDTVNFRPSYDGSHEEPVVLPAAVPNILANGTEGIAVGMATSIPPHNLVELCEGALHLINKPECELAGLLDFIKGPDLPTGGIIVETQQSIQNTYAAGRGTFRLRCRWHKEEIAHGQYRIIITEIPYQLSKKTLIEELASLYNAKRLPFIEDFQDISAEDIKIVIEPKSRNIPAESIMESLFKLSSLETKLQLNMNVLSSNGAPIVMGIKQILQEFIAHRLEVTKRRLSYRLQNVDNRLEILTGLLTAYLNLDELLAIIRQEDEPKTLIMAKWQLTETQANAILNMRLRSLRKLEELAIRQEEAELSKEKGEIEAILASESKLCQQVALNIKEVIKFYKKDALGLRRTSITEPTNYQEIDNDILIEKEPVTIICSTQGWIRMLKGHNHEKGSIKYKEGDAERFIIHALTTDKLIIATSYGKFYTINIDRLSRGKGLGEPIKVLLGLADDEDILNLLKFEQDKKLIMAAQNGKGFAINIEDVLAQTRAGKQIMNCAQEKMLICKLITGEYLAIIGDNHHLLIIPTSEVPILRKGSGVALQKYKKGGLRDIICLEKASDISWQDSSGKLNTLTNAKRFHGKRGGAGRLVLSKLWIDQ
jgi:topoisomerase-4 subunit A